MERVIEEERVRQQREAEFAAETRAHIRQLAERERLEQLRVLVAECGFAAVEKILKTTLPAELGETKE